MAKVGRMIRPTTLAMFALAAGAGGLLFQISFEVRALEDRLVGLNSKIISDQESIHVLRAEWSYLNQPSRLEDLAQRYLDLAPMETSQIQDFAALPMRPVPDSPEADEIATAVILADAKGLPRLKPAAPQRARQPDLDSVPEQRAEAILVAQPVRARTLGDVLKDVIDPQAVRIE